MPPSFPKPGRILTLCIDICRTSEDLSPEDKAAELLPIAVQQLYVLIQLGKLEEAEVVLKDIAVDKYVESYQLETYYLHLFLASPSYQPKRLPATTLSSLARLPSIPTSYTRPSMTPQMPPITIGYSNSRTAIWSATRTPRISLSRNMMA